MLIDTDRYLTTCVYVYIYVICIYIYVINHRQLIATSQRDPTGICAVRSGGLNCIIIMLIMLIVLSYD